MRGPPLPLLDSPVVASPSVNTDHIEWEQEPFSPIDEPSSKRWKTWRIYIGKWFCQCIVCCISLCKCLSGRHRRSKARTGMEGIDGSTDVDEEEMGLPPLPSPTDSTSESSLYEKQDEDV